MLLLLHVNFLLLILISLSIVSFIYISLFSFSEAVGRFQVCFGRYATTAARQVISDCGFQPQLVLFLYFKFMLVSSTMRCDFAYQVYVVLF
jgi:hypothetical protein